MTKILLGIIKWLKSGGYAWLFVIHLMHVSENGSRAATFQIKTHVNFTLSSETAGPFWVPHLHFSDNWPMIITQKLLVVKWRRQIWGHQRCTCTHPCTCMWNIFILSHSLNIYIFKGHVSSNVPYSLVSMASLEDTLFWPFHQSVRLNWTQELWAR